MATKNFVFRGKAVYPMLIEPDEFRGVKKWKIGVALDEPSWKLFKLSGLSLKQRTIDDEELSPYVIFNRKIDGKWVTENDPPKIEDWSPEDGLIGNGSLVEVTVQVYDTSVGNKGHRLMKVKVLDLVPYDGEGGGVVETIRPEDVEDVEEKPSKKTKKSNIKKVELNDELPF